MAGEEGTLIDDVMTAGSALFLYCVALLVVLFVPRCTSCGGCLQCLLWTFFMVPASAGMFFGGLSFSLKSPAYKLCNADSGPICAPCFFFVNFAVLMSMSQLKETFGMQSFLDFKLLGAAFDVDVCDASWQEYHAVYFQNGETRLQKGTWLSGGQEPVAEPVAASVHMTHCHYHQGNKQKRARWESCKLHLRPIFADAFSTAPCAWAASRYNPPPLSLDCSPKGYTSGLCGISTTVDKITWECGGDDGCKRDHDLDARGVEAFVRNVSFPVLGGLPMIELGNPMEHETAATYGFTVWAIAAFIYVPCQLCCCLLARFKQDASFVPPPPAAAASFKRVMETPLVKSASNSSLASKLSNSSIVKAGQKTPFARSLRGKVSSDSMRAKLRMLSLRATESGDRTNLTASGAQDNSNVTSPADINLQQNLQQSSNEPTNIAAPAAADVMGRATADEAPDQATGMRRASVQNAGASNLAPIQVETQNGNNIVDTE